MKVRSAFRNRLEDEIGRIDVVMVADADPEAGKLVGSEVGGDIAQAFLTAIGPARAGAGACRRAG